MRSTGFYVHIFVDGTITGLLGFGFWYFSAIIGLFGIWGSHTLVRGGINNVI
jgi:hypothetical protein